MTIRARHCRFVFLAALLLAVGCGESKKGPLAVSAIGGAPGVVNPNLRPLDPPSAFLIGAVAQGIVRFDATGQIEPALAQSWIVSDDGLRYTFRIAPGIWAGGDKVTAAQVTARLLAAASRASRNPLKPLLGAIDAIESMTENVFEIRLKAPRPNFLQLLAQPEMAIMRGGAGTGPYTWSDNGTGDILLSPIASDVEAAPVPSSAQDILLKGERAGLAVARFDHGKIDLVIGGTLGDLPLARAADPGAALRFDPVSGLLGLVFTGGAGIWGEAATREALSMAIDRPVLVGAFNIPNLQPRDAIVPLGIDELPAPAAPAWAAGPLAQRRQEAARRIAVLADGQRIALRVAIPEGPGYGLLFAYLRRDWRTIGVDAERVGPLAAADLRLLDEVAPATLSTWYLRHFTCDAHPICSKDADAALGAARIATTAAERQSHLDTANRLIEAAVPFVPLAAPVRWSLVGPRVRGFRPNVFGRRYAGSLIEAPP